MSRREDLLIYRPFEIEPFRQGQRLGPDLLLKTLRGEYVDCVAVKAELMPKAMCEGCSYVKLKEEYAALQWNRKDNKRFCKLCVERKEKEGTPFQCTNCGIWKTVEAFAKGKQHANNAQSRVCKDCVVLRRCRGDCGLLKTEKDFTTF